MKPGEKIEGAMRVKQAVTGTAHDSKTREPVVFMQLECEDKDTGRTANIYLAMEPANAEKLATQLIGMAKLLRGGRG